MRLVWCKTCRNMLSLCFFDAWPSGCVSGSAITSLELPRYELVVDWQDVINQHSVSCWTLKALTRGAVSSRQLAPVADHREAGWHGLHGHGHLVRLRQSWQRGPCSDWKWGGRGVWARKHRRVQGKELEMSRCGCCCCGIPWMNTLGVTGCVQSCIDRCIP